MCLENPKFLVDSMLGKVAKKLRVFGFDTVYLSDIEDDELIKLATITKRNLLTKDKGLHIRTIKLNIPCLLLICENELDNFIKIFKNCKIKYIFPATNDSTRCTICNTEIKPIKKDNLSQSLKENIPKKVFDNNNTFYKCIKCAKIYWNGTHIQDLNKLIDNINMKLN